MSFQSKFYLAALGLGLMVSLPASASLIGNDYAGNLYDINTATGAATNARPTGIANLMGIAFGSNGVLYGLATNATNVSLYTINPVSGASALVGTSAAAAFNDDYGEGDLRFNPATGTLYGVEYTHFNGGNSPPTQQELFTINTSTGATSNFTNLPFFNNSAVLDYSALTFDAAGNAYLLDTASLDPNGHLETGPLGSLTDHKLNISLGAFAGMDFYNGTLYVADGGTGANNDLYTLDPTTGNLTVVGSLGLRTGLAGLASSPTPEPGMPVLFATGIAFLAARFYRARKAKCPARI